MLNAVSLYWKTRLDILKGRHLFERPFLLPEEMFMFGMLENLTKAAVSIAVTPVALVADSVAIPLDADGNKPAFNRTVGMLSNAGECTKEALKPKG